MCDWHRDFWLWPPQSQWVWPPQLWRYVRQDELPTLRWVALRSLCSRGFWWPSPSRPALRPQTAGRRSADGATAHPRVPLLVARRGGVAVGAHRRLGCATSSPSSTSTDVADSSRVRTFPRTLHCHHGAAQPRHQGQIWRCVSPALHRPPLGMVELSSHPPLLFQPTHRGPRVWNASDGAWHATSGVRRCTPHALCARSLDNGLPRGKVSSPLCCVGALTGHCFQGSSSLGMMEGTIWDPSCLGVHRYKPFTGDGYIITDHRVTRVAHICRHSATHVCVPVRCCGLCALCLWSGEWPGVIKY